MHCNLHVFLSTASALALESLSLKTILTGRVQNLPLSSSPLFFVLLYTLVTLPKNSIPFITLSVSSRIMIVSSEGLPLSLPSAAAALAVMLSVTFLAIVPVFMMGTLPRSRLKTRTDFSASLTALTNFFLPSSSGGGVVAASEAAGAAPTGCCCTIRADVLPFSLPGDLVAALSTMADEMSTKVSKTPSNASTKPPKNSLMAASTLLSALDRKSFMVVIPCLPF